MATKQDLLDRLEAAGVEGFSLANTKAEIEEAVAALPPAPEQHPNRERYGDRSNRPHSVIGV